MLDPQQRDVYVKHVRPILVRYVERCEKIHDSNRSSLPILLRQIQYNVPPPPPDALKRSTIGDLEAWVLTVAWALAYVGPCASRVVLWRLTRRDKSQEASWAQIVAELRAIDYDVVVSDAKEMYELALPILSGVFEQIGVTTDVHGAVSRVTPAQDRCAAAENDLDCPIQTAAA